MSETMIMAMEVSFDIAYLVIIWIMVAIMYARGKNIESKEAGLWKIGFLLLALGDSGHVGFRVAAYALGSLSSTITIGHTEYLLVGIGSAATAYTITVLYMLMMQAWRVHNDRPKDRIYQVVMIASIVRMIIMAFPGNNWNSLDIPYTWSILRNAPLTIMGIIIAVRFLRSGLSKDDRFQKRLAYAIFVSFGFYLPVILFVRFLPPLGMLMMPKTVAYLFMAGFVLRELFPQKTSHPES